MALSSVGAYDRAINATNATSFSSDKGVFGNLKVLGERILVVRPYFAEALAEAAFDAVHSLALTIFRAAFALTFGLFFTNAEKRANFFQALGDFGTSIAVIAKSVFGVVSPRFGVIVNDFFKEAPPAPPVPVGG